MTWWIASHNTGDAVQQAEALFPIWYLRGPVGEGRAWLEEVLALATASGDAALQARTLQMFFNLARRHGDYAVALDALNSLLAVRLALGDAQDAARTQAEMANLHQLCGNYPAAWACLEASRVTVQGRPDAHLASNWRSFGAQTALHEGRYDLARSMLMENLDYEMSRQHEGANLPIAYCLFLLGTIAHAQGQFPAAEDYLVQALRLAARYGERSLLAHLLDGFSGLASALGLHQRAMRLGGAAEGLRDAISAPLHPSWRHKVEQWLAVSRAALTADSAAEAWRDGENLSLEQAIALADSTGTPENSTRAATNKVRGLPAAVQTDPLTRREREVAELVARGLNNRRIAEKLVITERTVASHIEHILDKLGFGSRTEIGVWAVEHDLIGPGHT
jgi:DNA-binding CsgD family transcriptional regulator